MCVCVCVCVCVCAYVHARVRNIINYNTVLRPLQNLLLSLPLPPSLPPSLLPFPPSLPPPSAQARPSNHDDLCLRSAAQVRHQPAESETAASLALHQDQQLCLQSPGGLHGRSQGHSGCNRVLRENGERHAVSGKRGTARRLSPACCSGRAADGETRSRREGGEWRAVAIIPPATATFLDRSWRGVNTATAGF